MGLCWSGAPGGFECRQLQPVPAGLEHPNHHRLRMGYQNDQLDFVGANILLRLLNDRRLISKLANKYQLISLIGSIFWLISPPIVPPYNLLMQEINEIEAANEANCITH